MAGKPAANSPDIVVFDRARRMYLAINHAGDGYHAIQPARPWDPRVVDGKIQVGQLVCTCEGGTFHGMCYATRVAMEIDEAPAAPIWARDIAPETELEKAAARG